MEAPVSVSLGVAKSLPAKLERLLSPEADHGLHKKEKGKIRLLKDHLQELIDKYLMEPSEVEAPTSTVRCWVKEVRELSYDIDDFLDELLHGHHADPKLRCRSQWIADKSLQFRTRLRDAIQRHKAYNLGRCKKRLSILASEERPLPPLYGLATARLVGVDSSIGKLEEWLTRDAERRLRVVSIVGLGGVGKTTLAKELYGKVDSQFECRAFARTSQKPDMRKLLSSILLQIRPERPPDASESSNLIDTIRAHLQHKKYFVIIDELWAPSTWDIVCRALPDDKCYSRVLITTEVDVIAQRCCGHNSEYILKMGPLRDEESRKLFFSRFPGDQSHNCEQSEVLFEIIRKCGGFPLATVTISNLLARQHSELEQCSYIRRSLSSNLRTNPSMEGMQQVLDLCYKNLPDRLKACMLYLSTYKEDHIIWKDDLVKQWIAEGFICAKEGNSMEEIACTYLDELVNGGMIQPVDVNYNGEVLSCTVHYMILNLIRYKSIEENFVTAIDGSQTRIRLADKVRRLSLLFGDADDAEPPANLRLSQVRSLVFYGFFKSLPSIVEFRHLRVLILHLWGDQDNISLDLIGLCKLVGLKYLEIVCHVSLSLQTEMQGLRYLETLKIDSTGSEVPQDIVHLPGLLHLSLPGGINLPNGIGRLATLQTFGCFDLTSNSAENVQSLSGLTNIWNLRLTCSVLQPDNLKKNMEHLGSVLSTLRNLKSLTLLPGGSYNENTMEASTSSSDISYDLSNVSSPSTLLEKLELMPRICILSALPEWIAKLRLLNILKIEVLGLSGGDIDNLQGLPALSALSLNVRTAPAERIIFHREGFPVLVHFVFICSALRVAFEEGAMPNVLRLKVGFNANTIRKYRMVEAGLQNLTGLQEFSAKIGGTGADEFSRQAIKSALEEIFCKNMSPPVINIQFVGWVIYGDKEISTASATQQIAEDASTKDTVTHHRDPAISYGDKEINTLPATKLMAEEGSPEDIVTALQDPAFSYGEKEIRTASATQQSAEGRSTEDIITHLRAPCFPFGDRKISTTLVSQKTAQESSTVDIVQADKNVSDLQSEASKLSAMARDVQNKVATKRLGSSKEVVENWLRRVDTIGNEAKKVSDDHAAICLPRLNCWTRYRISKRAYRKLKKTKELIQERDSFQKILESTSAKYELHENQIKTMVVGMDHYLDRALWYIDSDTVGIIGICGMGGVGKTALLRKIHGEFLPGKKRSKDFDKVVWAVVFKKSPTIDVTSNDIPRLQNDIARELGLYLDRMPDDYCSEEMLEKRALPIFEYLSTRNFLLLLDDLWSPLELRSIGVPNPTSSASSQRKNKVVLTSRSKTICGQMQSAPGLIDVQCLDDNDAWRLFEFNATKQTITSHRAITDLAWQVMKECEGLPLALNIIGKALSTKSRDPKPWREAYHKLKNARHSEIPGLEEENATMLHRIKISYDYLPSQCVQDCFLSCCLWPEDCSIEKAKLIECWLGLGLISGPSGIDDDIRVGLSIITGLKEAHLLEPGDDDAVEVRMHGMIRAMSLWISSDCGKTVNKWLVKAGIGIRTKQRLAVLLQGCSPDTERVSLMNNLFTELPSLLPRRDRLKVLMLQRNPSLQVVPGTFLLSAPALTYLDLSNTIIRELPAEICLLHDLQFLNLSESYIEKLPKELSSLAQLRQLLLNATMLLQSIPYGIISKLGQLQILDLFGSGYASWGAEGTKTKGASEEGNSDSDMCACLDELEVRETFIKWLGITLDSTENLRKLARRSAVSTRRLCLKRIRSPPVLHILPSNLSELLGGFDMLESLEEFMAMSITSFQQVIIDGGANHHMYRRYCLPVLEKLELLSLRNLEEIRFQRMPSSSFFPRLHSVKIVNCSKLRNVNWALYLPQLLYLELQFCPRMLALIDDTGDKHPTDEIEPEDRTFPMLKKLTIHMLKNLTSLCRGRTVHFPVLEAAEITECSKLRHTGVDLGFQGRGCSSFPSSSSLPFSPSSFSTSSSP